MGGEGNITSDTILECELLHVLHRRTTIYKDTENPNPNGLAVQQWCQPTHTESNRYKSTTILKKQLSVINSLLRSEIYHDT
jgi:hypothetical protein